MNMNTEQTTGQLWQRFYDAMAGDSILYPGNPETLSGALAELYKALQDIAPNALKILLDHPVAQARLKKVERTADELHIIFKTNWFSKVSIIANRNAVIGVIEAQHNRPFYRHVTTFCQDDLGNDARHITLKQIIRNELDLLFAEEHHWSGQFQKTIRAMWGQKNG